MLGAQLCPTLCDAVDCSPPGFSVHGILQARILEWVATPSSRGSSWPRNQTQVSCIAGRFFTVWANREAQGKVKTMGCWLQKARLRTLNRWDQGSRFRNECICCVVQLWGTPQVGRCPICYGHQWRNNSRKNEGMEPKWKQYPVVYVTGDRSKVQCYKEQYCIGTWNIRSMSQGKLEVVKQEMARVMLTF